MWSVWLVFCFCGFHSVCPLMDKDKRLMEASWWEGLAVGESGYCSGGCGLAQFSSVAQSCPTLCEPMNHSTPGPRRKQQWPYRRLSQTFLWVSRSLWQRHGLTLACCGVRSTESNSPDISPFEGGLHYCHYPYHSLASGQPTGMEYSPTHQQKIGLKVDWAWTHPSEQDPDSPTASPSHQEASISLLSLSTRGQTEWNP